MDWDSTFGITLGGLTAGLLLAVEAGYRLGRRRRVRTEGSDDAHLHTTQAALFGVLGLLLGFTFAMSVSRFDARRALVTEEANAIGTAALRAELLPDAQRMQMGSALRELVSARLAFFAAGENAEAVAAALAAAEVQERAAWTIAVDAARQEPQAVSNLLLLEALNEVIDLHEQRQIALESHVPTAVLALLLVVGALSLGFVGYGAALSGRQRPRAAALLALTVGLVLATILDLDRPRSGWIQVSQASMERLQADFARE